MQVNSNTIKRIFSRMRARLCGRDTARNYAGDEQPLRSELFSTDQMKQHGRTLASLHQLKLAHSQNLLLMRLAENEKLFYLKFTVF